MWPVENCRCGSHLLPSGYRFFSLIKVKAESSSLYSDTGFICATKQKYTRKQSEAVCCFFSPLKSSQLILCGIPAVPPVRRPVAVAFAVRRAAMRWCWTAMESMASRGTCWWRTLSTSIDSRSPPGEWPREGGLKEGEVTQANVSFSEPFKSSHVHIWGSSGAH